VFVLTYTILQIRFLVGVRDCYYFVQHIEATNFGIAAQSLVYIYDAPDIVFRRQNVTTSLNSSNQKRNATSSKLKTKQKMTLVRAVDSLLFYPCR
jgi:hypothetical protein